MDDGQLRERIRALLEEEGFGSLGLTLRERRDREHSTAYHATVEDTAGSADLEVYVYDLTNDPVGLVDAEEERIALTELASEFVPELLRYRSESDVAVLVVAYRDDARRVRRLLASGAATSELAYRSDLDRLVGADHLREIGGHLVRACIMSRSRAEALFAVLPALAAWVGSAGGGSALPQLLAVYEVEPIEAIRHVVDLPAEYDALVVVDVVISSAVPVVDAGELDPDTARKLAVRLFSLLRATHGFPATFSCAGASSIDATSVAVTGDLLDPYHVTAGAGLDPGVLADLQVCDLENALEVLGPVSAEVVLAGLAAYTGSVVVTPLTDLVGAVAERRTPTAVGLLASAAHRAAFERRTRTP